MRISYDGVPVLFAVTCCRFWYYRLCMPLLSSSLFSFFAFHFFHFFTHHRCFAPTVRDTFRGQGFARTEPSHNTAVRLFCFILNFAGVLARVRSPMEWILSRRSPTYRLRDSSWCSSRRGGVPS